MKAVVLVGGAGTRLRPLTYTTPKPLLPIANQAFLERQLTWLAAHGVDEAVLSLGYLPDAFVEHFPESRYGGLTLRYAVEPSPLGTSGGIRFAAALAGINERFVVCNGDVLTGLDLTALVAFHDTHGAEASIHLVQVDDPSAFGVVTRYDDDEVQAFVEKPEPGHAPSNWINAGTYVFEPSVLDRIPTDTMVSIERETFPQLLEERGKLYALASPDYWIDIGTPAKFIEAHTDLLRGALGRPPVDGASEITPEVWIQGEVSIAGDATVVGPTLFGDGAAVRGGAHVRGVVAGAGSLIGERARVEGSVLLAGAHLGADARVDSSIIGPGARVDDGAVVMAGSVIGADTHVELS